MAANYYVVAIEGLSALEQLDTLDPNITRYARMAVNKTLPFARGRAARSMEQQVKFPRGYLTGQDGRLAIAKYAKEDDLTGIVRGRDQPTSLARFVVGGAKVGKRGDKGVTVEVDPGIAKRMPSAFVIKLRNNNLGLAYRSADGTPPKSFGAKKLGEGLYLLYGPSVDQVFNKTREEIVPDAEEFMAKEFARLMKAGI